MTIREKIDQMYPDRATTPSSAQSIPRGVYMVYILVCDDIPIVVGHGKHNRARVIFDDERQTTSGHIKAIFVRAHHLFGNHKSLERFLIVCDDKNEAQEIEKSLHAEIGGNDRSLPDQIHRSLFQDIALDSIDAMVLNIALNSSFDGLADLKLWRRKQILNDRIWDVVATRLKLNDPL